MKNCQLNAINPGLLKLDLFCKGMRIEDSCRLDQDARPILRTRGGLGSGLEIFLPGGLPVNVPIREHFIKESPYSLAKNDGKYVLKQYNDVICDIILPSKPKFYDLATSSGKIMSRIGILQGTYLAVYPTKICEFWKMKPRMNCRFCSVGLNVGFTEELEKSVKDVIETVKAARGEEKVTFVHFNTGYLGGGDALDELVPYIKAVKEKTGLLIGVQSAPALDLSKYLYLKKIGVDHVSFCLELYDQQKFENICPGKSKYIGREKYLETIKYCVRVFGKGKVSGEIIAGLEDPSDTIKAIEYFGKIGVVSTVCVFRPCIGTDLEDLNSPGLEEMIPIFKRMYKACLENAIPFGIAPNIKVSLVLLPEEAKYLFSKQEQSGVFFFLARLKLKIIKVLFRLFFNFKLFLKC